MPFQISDDTSINHVTLLVRDLTKMTDFYVHAIGLSVLEETSKAVNLTIPGTEASQLMLVQGYNTTRNLHTTGLYHTAWVQPDHHDLANTLQHYQALKIPVFLAADHRFSQSLYVWDPEMNAVEVYYDLPRSTWLILPDGRMPQRTIPLDTEALLKEATGDWHGLATGSRLGHIHLRVAHLQPSTDFYRDILGFKLTDWMTPDASFLAADGYHHHVALNDWHGPYPEMAPNQTGLMDFTIDVGVKDSWAALKDHLDEAHWPNEITNDQISLKDPDHNQLFISHFAD